MPRNQGSPVTIVVILLLVFGGVVGAAAVATDYLSRNNYRPGPNQKSIIPQLLIAGFMMLLANSVLLGLSADLVIPGLGWLSQWTPGLVQAILGVVIVKKYLHRYNIYFTNPQVWEQVNAASIAKLSASDLKSVFTNQNQPSSPSPATTAPNSSHQHVPQSPYANQNHRAIQVDRSGDGMRVKIIMWAFFVLLGLLAYQYLAKNPEAVLERVSQVAEDYIEAELQ